MSKPQQAFPSPPSSASVHSNHGSFPNQASRAGNFSAYGGAQQGFQRSQPSRFGPASQGGGARGGFTGRSSGPRGDMSNRGGYQGGPSAHNLNSSASSFNNNQGAVPSSNPPPAALPQASYAFHPHHWVSFIAPPEVLSKCPQNSRLFIGNLASESTTKPAVAKIFAPYGNIVEIVLKGSYGFVQFESTRACEEARLNEQGKIVSGRRWDLKVAKDRRAERETGPSVKPKADTYLARLRARRAGSVSSDSSRSRSRSRSPSRSRSRSPRRSYNRRESSESDRRGFAQRQSKWGPAAGGTTNNNAPLNAAQQPTANAAVNPLTALGGLGNLPPETVIQLLQLLQQQQQQQQLQQLLQLAGGGNMLNAGVAPGAQVLPSPAVPAPSQTAAGSGFSGLLGNPALAGLLGQQQQSQHRGNTPGLPSTLPAQQQQASLMGQQGLLGLLGGAFSSQGQPNLSGQPQQGSQPQQQQGLLSMLNQLPGMPAASMPGVVTTSSAPHTNSHSNNGQPMPQPGQQQESVQDILQRLKMQMDSNK
ncbi:hypothetical protein HDU85_000363 [Gaertneriomyces sp. JEL0708]|nr:hypothetical protein HDU85_000363 [Gaertneriomyces sp. JEL0708]